MNSLESLPDSSTPDAGAPVAFPPAPWSLNGQLYGSIWTVPRPAFKYEFPSELVPLVNLGRVGVFAGFVDYQPGSILTYHELIAGVVVHLKGSFQYAFNITHIWVDDEVSRQGGRELWGVPKELAGFEYRYRRDNRDFEATAQLDGKTLAQGNFSSLAGLPVKLKIPVPFPNLQLLRDQPHRSSGTFWSSLQISRSGMIVPDSSPLAVLGVAGRKPLISFAGLNFKMFLRAARPVATH